MTAQHRALPAPIAARIAPWPDRVQRAFLDLRATVLAAAAAAEVGALEESLKWGQSAWRPRRARTGCTLRADWSDSRPTRLQVFVDCKTRLAAQMDHRFPGAFENDGRRSLAFDVTTDLPHAAIHVLAHLTFTYHRAPVHAQA